MVVDLVERLTPRERECLRLVDRHLSSKQIARELGMSKTSVDTYCDRARRKLGAGDRYEAARRLADHDRDVLIASGHDPIRTDAGVVNAPPGAAKGAVPHGLDARPDRGRSDESRYRRSFGPGLLGDGDAVGRAPGDHPAPGGRDLPDPMAGGDGGIPGFTWEQLERQLSDLAGDPVKAVMARDLVSATRKMSRFKPPEMVLREILCMSWALLDEGFRPDPDWEAASLNSQ
jgi:DNA-binding CsgD family transcriptional regulator